MRRRRPRNWYKQKTHFRRHYRDGGDLGQFVALDKEWLSRVIKSSKTLATKRDQVMTAAFVHDEASKFATRIY